MAKSRAYYNTTNLTAELHEKFQEVAGHQDRAVLSSFASGAAVSPSQCWDRLTSGGMLDANTPLTSIRRSITNLANKGLLVKTEQTVPGAFGRPEYCWQIALKEPRQLTIGGINA